MGSKIALVLSAEGKGLLRLTREPCDVVAGSALYLAAQHLAKSG